MSRILFLVLLFCLAGCASNNSKEVEKQGAAKRQLEENSFDTELDRDSCWSYLQSLMSAMDNSRLDSALEMNSAYSLFCKQDSLTWLTGQLDIARRIYKDHDSSIHYLKLIYARDDFRKQWKEEELLIGLALHFDTAGAKDSTCRYLQKLEEIGKLHVLEKKYPDRVNYCD